MKTKRDGTWSRNGARGVATRRILQASSILAVAVGCSLRGPAETPAAAEPAAASVAALANSLEGGSREAQIAAVNALGKIGPAAREAVAPLSKLVVTPEWRISQPSASALAKIDIDALVALLTPRLKGSDETAKAQAVKALEYVGPAAAPFVPLLTDAVRTAEDGWTRAAAANGLGQIGPAAADAVPVLIEGLAHPTEHVRRYCAKGLGGIGAKAAAAVPALEKAAARETDARFAAAARTALDSIRRAGTSAP